MIILLKQINRDHLCQYISFHFFSFNILWTYNAFFNLFNDKKAYLSMVMNLMFAATKTRPDIVFPVSTLASKSSDPRESDGHAVNRIYQYLRGTKEFKFD